MIGGAAVVPGRPAPIYCVVSHREWEREEERVVVFYTDSNVIYHVAHSSDARAEVFLQVIVLNGFLPEGFVEMLQIPTDDSHYRPHFIEYLSC